MEWVTFTKRTADPKLAYLEHRLTKLSIPHQRMGESWHAPILAVPQEHLDRAWELLNEQYDEEVRLDDMPDDDEVFAQYTPHDWPEKPAHPRD